MRVIRINLVTLILLAAIRPAPAQTETVLYSFGVSPDGQVPYSGLIIDKSGNLYGTTESGGTHGFGTVFEVTPSTEAETVLYSFLGSQSGDGAYPYAGLVMDAAGSLYGTTNGGGANSVGTVFKLSPAKTERILHSFSQSSDGYAPFYASLAIDAKGNLYGTTGAGGTNFVGTAFKVRPTGAESLLYSFCSQGNCTDGLSPDAGLIDKKGNFYGTTAGGGANASGTVFELTSTGTETVLYSFNSAVEGYTPLAGLIMDKQGNLYGTTNVGGTHGFGTVFEVNPSTGTETVLYNFGSQTGDGQNPQYCGLVMDARGNLYGTTTYGGAHGFGTVFRLKPSTGTETVLYSFGSQTGDGHFPWAGLVIDSMGNLYGTTEAGGANSFGAVFKVTP